MNDPIRAFEVLNEKTSIKNPSKANLPSSEGNVTINGTSLRVIKEILIYSMTFYR